ncbi:MAG: MFS transporter [Candidatus Hodarchaeales archaeon]|jgi:DHA1 family multidrug resistance protein-like MFS transporter
MKSVNFHRLNIITLTVTHFLWGFVNFVFRIQIQPYLLSIYGTTAVAAQILGLILSIGTLSAVFPLILAFIADFYGRKNLIIFGQILCVIGLIGLSTSTSNILVLLFGIIAFNLGTGFYDAPLQGLIYESSIKKRGLAFSIIYNSAYLAGIIASLSIQEGNTGYISYFQVGFFLITIAGLLNIIALRDVFPNSKQIKFPIARILKDPLSRLTAFTFALDAFIWGLPLAIANGLFIILFDVDVSFIASLTLMETIVLVLLANPAGMIVDRFGRVVGLICGEVIGFMWIFFILAAIAIPSMATNLLILAYAFLGAVVAFWRPSVTLSFISIDPSAATTNFGILAFFQRLGRVPSAIVSGFLFSLIGFPPLLFITFFGTLIVIAVFIHMDKIEKKLDIKENNKITIHS